MSGLRAIGKNSAKELELFKEYRLPIFDEDFGNFIAILDNKSWKDQNRLWCFFALENGQQIRILLYKNKNGKFTSKNDNYDFSLVDNFDQVFKITIAKNGKGNSYLEFGKPTNNISKEDINLINDEINKSTQKKLIKNIDYYSQISDNKLLKQGFFDACKNGDLELVKFLLIEKNVDINTEDFNGGSSGLRLASSEGHLAIVKFLLTSKELNKHADHEMADKWSKFPALRLACNNEQFKVINFLLKKEKCPQLLNDGKCNLYGNKPEMCNLVPFQAVLPEHLQFKLADHKDNLYIKEGCLTQKEQPGFIKVYDQNKVQQPFHNSREKILKDFLENANLVVDFVLFIESKGMNINYTSHKSLNPTIYLEFLYFDKKTISLTEIKQKIGVQNKLLTNAINESLSMKNKEDRDNTNMMRSFINYNNLILDSI